MAGILPPDLAAAVARMNQIAEEIDQPPNKTAYSTSNVTGTRTIDVSTATLADVADVLATLIQDLKRKGVVR